MDGSTGGSFIPKRNVNKKTAKTGRRVYIFTYVAYVVFFGTLMAVIGVFVVNQQVSNKQAEFVEAVDEAQSLFDRDQIESLIALESKIKLAENLLDQHISAVQIFNGLEESVLERAQIESFELTRDDSGMINLVMDAKVEDFDQAIIQR